MMIHGTWLLDTHSAIVTGNDGPLTEAYIFVAT